jgi:uncharacterized protein YraI
VRHLSLGLALLAGCAGASTFEDLPDASSPAQAPADAGTPLGDPSTPDVSPDGAAAPELDGGVITVGQTARVTASALNLRSGPGTTNAILTVMLCGDQVDVIGGPMNTYWWNVRYGTYTGWASGHYLVAESAFDPAVCAQTPDAGAATTGDLGPLTIDQTSIFARAKLGVGYSYYWGHGSWRADGTSIGSCLGTCPNCSHSGQYGADCSGFVAKCWQIPSPSPIEVDLHPYSTWNFYNQTTHWSPVPRTQMQPADAFVYNANGSGHIALFESGADPWGNVWLYEARGCATGIVHDLRTVSSTYIAIRREGL